MRMRCPLFAVFLALVASAAAAPATPAAKPILFDASFESGSIGLIEKITDTEYRLHIKGQQDARGRNRQATWFAFRMDDVAGREVTLRLGRWKGEYNDRPANAPMGEWFRPVVSDDGETWEHLAAAAWDVGKDELTITVRPRGNSIWIAHIQPYTFSRLQRLLGEIDRSPHARIEVIGRSVQGRELHVVTVTNHERPDANKKVVWLQARQHAWETGTSFMVEGALRFVTSDDAAARKLRDETIFKFVPMINPDSVVRGEVRFNLRGIDPNRLWPDVDLRDKVWLERAPEIWYVKKAILEQHARRPINLLLNLHNTETAEYLDTMVDDDVIQPKLHRFFDEMVKRTAFDPSRPKLAVFGGTGPGNTTNSIWREARVPSVLMEARIGPSRKAGGRIMTAQDRMELGRATIQLMAEAVR